MTFHLVYKRPLKPADPVANPDNAVYALGRAGATAAVEVSSRYCLDLDGPAGLAELHQQVERLLIVMTSGEPAPGDDQMRAHLPDVPAAATIHSWHFSSYMVEIPVIAFAIDGLVTRVYTRTLSEALGHPLVVAEDRDLADPVEVTTAALLDEARNFINEVGRDSSTLTRRES